MRISNYEHTGLDGVNQWLAHQEDSTITKETLGQLLRTTNVTFVLEGINRLQSMLLCELKDSYVQQSQRYVIMAEDGYSLPDMDKEDTRTAKALIAQAFALYQEMTTLKGEFKGRPKPEHYCYGIPVEDARYLFPVAVKTNITVALSGDKLLDLFRLFQHPQYQVLFAELRKQVLQRLPEKLGEVLRAFTWSYEDEQLVADYYQPQLAMLGAEAPVKLLAHFASLDLKVGLGALTSTMAKAPSQVLAGWGEQALDKAQAVTNRVLGYGHDSIAEQGRVTFGLMFSLVTYHQQVRHRLTANYREPLETIVDDMAREVMIPPSILGSQFEYRYREIATNFKQFRKSLKEKYSDRQYLYFLLNCDQVKVIMGSNARTDNQMLQERICYNAQWEIRQISVLKLAQLRQLSNVLYRQALPSCVYGVCKEGKYTCGRAYEMRKQYGQED